jgi:HEAT repeat protein
MFRREEAVGVIAAFKQERCIPILLNVLAKDSEPQVRVQAVHCVSALSDAVEDKRIEPALRYALKKDVDWVAVAAAEELGRLNSNAEEVVRLTFDLARRVDRDDERERAAKALVAHRDKLAVDLTIQLLQEFGKRQDDRVAVLVERIASVNGTLYSYVAESSPQPVPQPATPAEWASWWK